MEPKEEFKEILQALALHVSQRDIHQYLKKTFPNIEYTSSGWISDFKTRNRFPKQYEVILPNIISALRNEFGIKTKYKKRIPFKNKYRIFYSNTAVSDRTINFSNHYIMQAESDQIKIINLKNDTIELKGGIVKDSSSNFYVELTHLSTSEKVYWILKDAYDYNVLSGLFLTIDSHKNQVSGPVLLMEDDYYQDPQNKYFNENFFAYFYLNQNSILKGISFKDHEGSLIQESGLTIKRFRQLSGTWKIIRWNEAESKYSIYKMIIDKDLKITCITSTNTFSMSIYKIGRDRIKITGFNETKDIMMSFYGQLNSADRWEEIDGINACYCRISPLHMRYGDAVFRRSGRNEKITPSHSDPKDIKNEKDITILKQLGSNSYTSGGYYNNNSDSANKIFKRKISNKIKRKS
ncbi:MAG: hypothetical protein U0073_02815 [Bacteroidia bacterium]